MERAHYTPRNSDTRHNKKQHGTPRRSATPCHAPRQGTRRQDTPQHDAVRCGTARRSHSGHGTTHHGKTRRGTARQKRAHHNTAQTNMAQDGRKRNDTARSTTAHHNTKARDTNRRSNPSKPPHSPEGEETRPQLWDNATPAHCKPAKGQRTPGNDGGGPPTQTAIRQLKPAPQGRRNTEYPTPPNPRAHRNRLAQPLSRQSHNLTRQELPPGQACA